VTNTEKKIHKTLTPNPLKKVKVAGRQLVYGKLTEAVFVQKPGVAHRMYGKPNKRPKDGKQKNYARIPGCLVNQSLSSSRFSHHELVCQINQKSKR
jgi:hypothetical protein